MSKLVVVGVMDSAIQAFGRPVFVPAIGAALRSFTDEVNRAGSDNALNAHPDDFVLVLLGYFDEESGVFSVDENGQRVLARGKDVKNHDAS